MGILSLEALYVVFDGAPKGISHSRTEVWETWIMPFLGGLQGLGQLSILRRIGECENTRCERQSLRCFGCQRRTIWPRVFSRELEIPTPTDILAFLTGCFDCCVQTSKMFSNVEVKHELADFSVEFVRFVMVSEQESTCHVHSLRLQLRHYPNGKIDAGFSAAADDPQELGL